MHLHLDIDGRREDQLYCLARVAKAVYTDQVHIDHPDVKEAFPQQIQFSKPPAYCLVAANDEHVVLAFRGRDEESEWLSALSYGQVDWGPGRAHKGLVDELDSVWNEVLAAFYDVGADRKTLWQTGHSLGGALAVLAALRLAHEGFEPHLTATFGSPPVIDPHAAKAIAWPVYRVINNEDSVANFHWPTLFDTYAHVGERVFLLPSGQIAEARHSPHLARRIDRANTIGDGPIRSGFVHDHMMDNYLKKLAIHAVS